VNSADIHQDIVQRLRHWRMRLLRGRLLLTISVLSVSILICMLIESTPVTMLLTALIITVLMLASLFMGQQWRKLSADNFVLHLNRRFPSFEESAQLLLKQDADLSPLQGLQRDRAKKVYHENLTSVKQWQPLIKHRLAVVVLIMCLPLMFFSAELRSLATNFYIGFQTKLSPAMQSGQKKTLAVIDSTSIVITPPAYTSLSTAETDQLDLEVVEGSEVQWTLSFSGLASAYALEFSGGERLMLGRTGGDDWQVTSKVRQSNLYTIVSLNGTEATSIGDIHTLTVFLDQVPKIRVLEPKTSTFEIPKNGPAEFSSSVLVSDDYGIQDVTILASVAKGSGEGVKFRDQQLTFDDSIVSDNGTIYLREWDLVTLGMEPGDEIYFTVIATDNKQPEANTGRSETLIVRWLEDEKAGLAAEGLAIDFIPEFFKSQRQIIIDTEQLIEDEKNLDLQLFKDTSYEIGRAQADLKQKYGQYLGDEVGEGPGEQLGGEGHDDDERNDEHGHENELTVNTRISTTAEILQLFGHNHGDPELGPITKRNPVALMKRAVSEMWQAERHLMQAEPVLALPFEYEAYKYLKLARQADRIYVKRLGFEPPPVTEDRRLTGELDEILTYQTGENTGPDDHSESRTQQILLRDVWLMFSTQLRNAELSAEQIESLTQLSGYFMGLSKQRPALIKQAATVEKLLLAGRLHMNNCENCIQELNTTIWNLMDDAAAHLQPGKAAYFNSEDLIKAYQNELQLEKRGVNP
jgi:hypothetical protein